MSHGGIRPLPKQKPPLRPATGAVTSTQIGGLLRQRSDQHDHLAAFHLGEVFHLADVLGVLGDPFQQFAAKVLVRHLAATEAQGDLDLVTFLKELEDRAHLDLVVMLVGIRAEFDFLDLDDLLLLARFGFALLGLVFVFAEIHDLADRGFSIGRDLDKIKTRFFGHYKGPLGRHDAHVLTICADQPDFGGADTFIDAGASLALRGRVMRSAGYGSVPSIINVIRGRNLNAGRGFFKQQIG